MTDKAKRFIARAPVSVAGHDYRPGDTITDPDHVKGLKDDIEAERVEEMQAQDENVARQHHMSAVVSAIEKAADAIASDKVADAREQAAKAQRDREAAERESMRAAKDREAAEATNPAGGVVLDTDSGSPKFKASGKK